MDTDAYVTAIRRFIPRRGQPLTILSDNGTNFVGTKREFDEFFRKLDQNSIQDKLISNQSSSVVYESTCSPTIWWLLGKNGKVMQNKHVTRAEESKIDRRRPNNCYMHSGQNAQRKATNNAQWRCERL